MGRSRSRSRDRYRERSRDRGGGGGSYRDRTLLLQTPCVVGLHLCAQLLLRGSVVDAGQGHPSEGDSHQILWLWARGAGQCDTGSTQCTKSR